MEQPTYTEEEMSAVMAEITPAIANGEALARLMKNKDFKAIILTSYLEKGSNFLVKNIVKVGDELEPKVVEQMKARGELYRHFEAIEEKFNEAKATLMEIEG